MAEQQVYFVHAACADQRFDHQFLATSKRDAEEQMKQYVFSQLTEGCDLAKWKFSVHTKDEEKAFRALDEKRLL
jgi:hypothetical protein